MNNNKMANKSKIPNHEPRATNHEPGFSLIEVLMAAGILAIGMMFVAGTFPVGISLTTVAVERTTAAVVADEAFAKIKLSGLNFADPDWPTDPNKECVDYERVANDNPGFTYPSTSVSSPQYYWSALCRMVDEAQRIVQVTVFVSRKTNPNTKYRDPTDPLNGEIDWPKPVPVFDRVRNNGFRIRDTERQIIPIRPTSPTDIQYSFISPGATIVDNVTGRLYCVLDRVLDADGRTWNIILEKPWEGEGPLMAWVWVVPPPVDGGRYPCIGVFQRIIKF